MKLLGIVVRMRIYFAYSMRFLMKTMVRYEEGTEGFNGQGHEG
jgi:hypothetical protein